MEILFDDQNSDDSKKLITKVFKQTLKQLNQPDNLEIEVLITGCEKIRDLNSKSRGIDDVTDVLSFPMLELKAGEVIDEVKFGLEMNLETGNTCLGSIVICLERAKQQSEEYGHSFERETAYLSLHGLLHLLGYDHEKETDKVIMRQAEENILSTLNFTR